MKTLILFYSRDGRTKTVGKQIAKELKADIEEIIDTKKRRGLIPYILAGRDALKKKFTTIKPVKSEVHIYDLVIVGTPIWAGTITPAIRTVLENFRFKKLAFFAVSGDTKDQKIFRKMEEASKKPVATLHFSTKEVKEGKISEKINEFVKKLK